MYFRLGFIGVRVNNWMPSTTLKKRPAETHCALPVARTCPNRQDRSAELANTLRALFLRAVDHPLTEVDESVLIPARHGVGQPTQFDGKLVQVLGQQRDGHKTVMTTFAVTRAARNNILPKPPRLATLIFGDVSRFVDGSVIASTSSYNGICENSGAGYRAAQRRPTDRQETRPISRTIYERCDARSEVPVLVLGDDGFADHVRRARAGEEVVVLVGVR